MHIISYHCQLSNLIDYKNNKDNCKFSNSNNSTTCCCIEGIDDDAGKQKKENELSLLESTENTHETNVEKQFDNKDNYHTNGNNDNYCCETGAQ